MSNYFRRNFLRSSTISAAGMLLTARDTTGKNKHEIPSTVHPEAGSGWKNVLELNTARKPVAGSYEALTRAIKRGADLRIYTEFRHNEHIDTTSKNPELIREVADFRVTYLVDNRWAAGIINLRLPISLPDGFGPRPSMSFFLYNQNAEQAIARPYLDGGKVTGNIGTGTPDDHSDMPKYHQWDAWDTGTNAPSSNFVYDFEKYCFWVCDNWEEVYANNASGDTISGSLDALVKAFTNGREVKVAISGLCDDLVPDQEQKNGHEVFIQCGSCYYYTQSRLFCAASHPVVRIKPAIPMRYKSREWDFGWLMPRSDGHVARWIADPYTLQFSKSEGKYGIRWFVR